MRTAPTTTSTPRATSPASGQPFPTTDPLWCDDEPVIAPESLGERIGRAADQALFALVCVAVVVLFPVLECARMALDAVARSDD